MKFKINKRLLPMKAHYFLANAGTAPVVPYMPTYARQLGISASVVGTIYLILPFIGLLVKPIFGAIADRFQRQKLIFILFQLLTAVSFFGIMFIPSFAHEANVDFHCNDGVSDLRYCPPVGKKIDEKLIMELTRDRSNETIVIVTCDLRCTVNESWMWDVICKEWENNSLSCDKNQTEFHLTVKIDLNHIEKNGDCLYFENKLAFMNNDERYLVRCPATLNKQFFKSQCFGTCDNDLVTKAIIPTELSDTQVTQMYQFWLFFFCMAFSWIGMAVVVSVGDAICFDLLAEKFNLYGNQRLWGSVGWGTVSIFSGLLVDAFSRGQTEKDYSILFYIMLFFTGFDMLVSTQLRVKQTSRSSNIAKDIGLLFLSFPIIVFFIWCIVVGLCTALIWNFLFWHLEELADAQNAAGDDTQKWIKTLQGFVMVVQCFGGELPSFFISGYILKKIGHVNAMHLVLFGFGARFMFYSILSNPWYVLPIELLNGITFGIFYATMASYAKIVAPPGTETTLQGIVGATFEGVGVSFGSFIGGLLMEKVGGSVTFRLFGLGVLVFGVLHVIIQKILEKYCPQSGAGVSAHYSTPSDALSMLSDDNYLQIDT